ncbi:tripartite motif-containing protein 16-like isoform X3 [Brachyhypopomus gauderio]|uniref:tripartite motif-containing protein 16-like isoform X3 n=1 Tax=Brachyhypopomus gauderio TaxID=698409 RepID=UPI00404373A6
MEESSSPPYKGRNMDEPPAFKCDSSSLLSEDQFMCSVCLDEFTDPVTTPCGHNFCKTCLTQYWDNSPHCHCPLCKETFTKRPELKINTTLREVVDHFMKKKGLDKPAVLCDVCTGMKLKAVKSCLNCGLTFCKSHLELHYNVPKLMKHKLINPVENVEDYICQKHERPLELFCREDEMCVCQFCTETDHKTHKTVTIEEESGEKRGTIKIQTQLGKTQSEIQQMIQERLKNMEEIKHSVELRKKITEREIADSIEVFTAMVRSIERSQAELLQVMEEKQKAADRQAEGLIKDLEQEITELKRRDSELEQLSHTEDHIHLLQIYPTMNSPPHTKNWTDISINTDVNVETVRKVLSQLQEKLSETLNTKLKQAGIIIWKHGLNFHCYAVDIQIYISTASPQTLSACISDLKLWLHQNDLKLNAHKTEVLVVGSKSPLLDITSILMVLPLSLLILSRTLVVYLTQHLVLKLI